jgi:predicted nucleotidyltransferase
MAEPPPWWTPETRARVLQCTKQCVAEKLPAVLGLSAAQEDTQGEETVTQKALESDGSPSRNTATSDEFELIDAWVFGSLVHGNWHAESDVDIIAVVSGPKSFRDTVKLDSRIGKNEKHANQDEFREVEVNVMHEVFFRASLRRHLLTSIFCLFTPPAFVLLETSDYAGSVLLTTGSPSNSSDGGANITAALRKPRMRRAGLQEGGHSLAKARRLFRSGDRIKGAKNLTHGLRFLRVTEQLVQQHVASVDWTCANGDQRDIFARVPRLPTNEDAAADGGDTKKQDAADFEILEKTFRPVLSDLMHRLEHEWCLPVDPPDLESSAAASSGSTKNPLASLRWLSTASGALTLRRELSIDVVESISEGNVTFMSADRGYSTVAHDVVRELWHGMAVFPPLVASGTPRIAWPGPRFYDSATDPDLPKLNWRNVSCRVEEDGILVTMVHSNSSVGQDPSKEEERGDWQLFSRRGDARSDVLFDAAAIPAIKEDGSELHCTVARELFSRHFKPGPLVPKLVDTETFRFPCRALSVADLFWETFERLGCQLPTSGQRANSSSDTAFTFRLFGGLATGVRASLSAVSTTVEVMSDSKLQLVGARQVSAPFAAVSPDELTRLADEIRCALAQNPFGGDDDDDDNSSASSGAGASSPDQSKVRACVLAMDPLQHCGVSVHDYKRDIAVFFPCPAQRALKMLIRGNTLGWADDALRIRRSVLEVVRSELFRRSSPDTLNLTFPELEPDFDEARADIRGVAHEIRRAFREIDAKDEEDFSRQVRLSFS